MEKEVLEKMEKVLKDFSEKEFGLKEEDIKGEQIIKNINKIEEGRTSTGYIYISDNGMSVEGTTPQIMCLLSNLFTQFVENGIPKDLLEKTYKIGVANMEEKEKMLKDRIKTLLEKMED